MWQTLEVISTLVIPIMLHSHPYMIESLLKLSAIATLFNTLT